MPAVFKVSVEFEKQFTFADFDKKTLKKFLRKIGTQTAKTARSFLKRGAKGQVSKPGANPLVQSGVTVRSIKGKPSRSGFSSVIAPFKTPKMGPEFYPAATFYGHRGPGKGAGGTRKRRAQNIHHGKVAAPRNNYIFDAVKKNEDLFKKEARQALQDSIIAKTMVMK